LLNIHVTFVTYTYNASVSIDEIALSSLKAIDHRYNKMFPVHLAIDHRYNKMFPVHLAIDHRYNKMFPVHLAIDHRYNQMFPVYLAIDHRYNQMFPVYLAIDHRYNQMFPVHFAMDFLLFLIVYECAVLLPYICEIKKVTQPNVSRAYHGDISATLIGVLLVFTNLCYLVQPLVSYFNIGAKSLYQY